MPLTDTAIRNAKPSEKPIRLFDGGGLYLEVAPSGGKWWRLKYRFAGKEKRLSLGVYPEIGLKEARDRREEAKRLLGEGIDPSVERKVQKATTVERAANSFEAVAREWHAKYAPGWSESNAAKVIARLQNDVFPWLGGRPIAELKAPELLAVCRRVESRGALDTAHRVLQTCGQIFRYAVATGRAERDPSAKASHQRSRVRPSIVGFQPTKLHDEPAKMAGFFMDAAMCTPVIAYLWWSVLLRAFHGWSQPHHPNRSASRSRNVTAKIETVTGHASASTIFVMKVSQSMPSP